MRYVFMLMAATSLAACSAGEQNEAAETAPGADAMASDTLAADAPAELANPSDMPSDAQGYVQAAGAGDLYEIQSSQMALDKGQGDQVREFAQHMIEDHRMTTDQVTSAARDAGLAPGTPQLDPMQQDMMTQLQAASGEDFDRLYLQQQRQAHQMALALQENYAQNGDTAELKQVAQKAVPIIQEHIARLQDLDAG